MSKKWAVAFSVGLTYSVTLFLLNKVIGFVPALEVFLLLAWLGSVPASLAMVITTNCGFGAKAFHRPSTLVPGLSVLEPERPPSVAGAAAAGFLVGFVLTIAVSLAGTVFQ